MDDARSVASGSVAPSARRKRRASLREGKARLRALQEELAQAKEARKLVEQDAQLLANRIALLKQEEEKAWKKIRQTKTRAQDILRLRAENEERVLARQAAAEELHAQQREVVDRHYQEKEMQKRSRQRLIAEKEAEKRRAAHQIKVGKLRRKKEVERRRRSDVAKAKRTKMAIKRERELARKRREQTERERTRKNKLAYDKRVDMEDRMRLAKEDEVARLEAMEMQLIERLKKTQAQQQKAYQDLEAALTSNGKA